MRNMILALLLGLSTAPAYADRLGRLFFTPEQRATLEQIHEHNATAEYGLYPSSLTVNGIIQKKGGGRIVWINGVAQSAGRTDENKPEALPISVPEHPHPVEVKVSQTLMLERPPQADSGVPPLQAQHAPDN